VTKGLRSVFESRPHPTYRFGSPTVDLLGQPENLGLVYSLLYILYKHHIFIKA